MTGLKVKQYRRLERSSPIMIERGVSLRSLLGSFLAEPLSWVAASSRAIALNSADGLAGQEAAAVG